MVLRKNHVQYVPHKGKLLKQCQGTSDQCFCCGYYTLQTTTGCPYDCSYCFLQSYENRTGITQIDDYKKVAEEINTLTAQKEFVRIGTGELADSLALDGITNASSALGEIFDSLTGKAVLELKTKSTAINNLLKKTYRNVIVAWSLNSERQQRNEEHNTPSVHKRIAAAAQAARAGYPVAFHFDPIVYTPSWKREYKKTIDVIYDAIPTRAIVWISLGCVRYPPAMRHIIRERHLTSRIVSGELLTGFDEKMRYPTSLRIEMYNTMKTMIYARNSRQCIYLCMESPEVWKSFDPFVTSEKILAHKLDLSAQQYIAVYTQ